MKLCSGTLDGLIHEIGQRKIILYGTGGFFRDYVSCSFPMEWAEQVAYAIDKFNYGQVVSVRGKEIAVYQVEKIKEETNCIVMLTSSTVLYEMYEQLQSLQLGENIHCYAYPFILIKSAGKSNPEYERIIFCKNGQDKIVKTIHSFWFSGDKKPREYQKCMESWKRICPDYEIKEWNLTNYDYTSNQFMEQAIRKKKWAFAADVARLDVIYRLGGIYMDMDVELLKPLDQLLKNEAFFSFDMNHDLCLEVFGAEKENEFLKILLQLYDQLEFDGETDAMNRLCQPVFIRKAVKEFGVKYNGDMQYVNHMAFLPRYYLSPKDAVIYENGMVNEDTIAIHHYHSGWKDSEYTKRKINSARKLWNLIEGKSGYGNTGCICYG